jgi:protein SMG6
VIELLDEGLEFYTEMLETLDKTYHIGLEQYYDVLEIRSSDTKIRCALVSAQKCLLCLGDLARYKEMIQNTSNYGKARQYYQKASHIDTRNAKPFNQLAILAWTAKGIFFFVKSLTSPFNHSSLTRKKMCLK